MVKISGATGYCGTAFYIRGKKMENLVRLSGNYFDEDKRLIESGIEEKKVFILMNLHEKLNTYIDYMFREVKVKNSDLCRLKICRQYSGSVV